MSSINCLPNDVVNYEILSYLSDSDHTKFARTNHKNYIVLKNINENIPLNMYIKNIIIN